MIKEIKGGKMYKITENLSDGDVIELCLNYTLRLEKCDENIGCIFYGPIAFSVAIDEKKNEDGELFYSSKWNVAIINNLENIKVLKSENNNFSFKKKNPPIYLMVPVRRDKRWKTNKTSMESLMIM